MSDRGVLSAGTWRPAVLSASTVLLLSVPGILALATFSDAAVSAAVGLATGCCLAVASRLVTMPDRRLVNAVGVGCSLLAGVGALATVGSAVAIQTGGPPTLPLPPLRVAPFVLGVAGLATGFGSPAVLWGLGPTEEIETAMSKLVVVAAVPLGALGILVVSATVGTLPDPFKPLTTALFGDDVRLITGVLVTAGMGVTLAVLGRWAFHTVPLLELAHEKWEPSIEIAHTVFDRGAWLLAGISVGLGVGVPVALRLTGPATYPAVATTATDIARLSVSESVRTALAVGIAVSVTTLLVVKTVWRGINNHWVRRFPTVWIATGGGVVGLAVALQGSLGARLTTQARERLGIGQELFVEGIRVPVTELTTGLAAGSLVLLLGIWTLSMVASASKFRVISDRMGSQLATLGVFLAAVGAAISGAHLAVVAGGVALSLLVWDVAEYATTLGVEIGRQAETRRAELVHLAGGGLVAVASTASALGTSRAVAIVPRLPQTAALLTVSAAVVGTILLATTAR